MKKTVFTEKQVDTANTTTSQVHALAFHPWSSHHRSPLLLWKLSLIHSSYSFSSVLRTASTAEVRKTDL
jgi:hypothetical protein